MVLQWQRKPMLKTLVLSNLPEQKPSMVKTRGVTRADSILEELFGPVHFSSTLIITLYYLQAVKTGKSAANTAYLSNTGRTGGNRPPWR